MPSCSSSSARPALHIADGALEALKWLALVAMTIDHINTYLVTPRQPALYAIGRLAFPLFAFVLAVNLARPHALARGVHRRVMQRLALFGALALVPFTLLWQQRWGWWPLNILFTFLVATLVIALLAHGGGSRRAAAALVFLFGGTLVDYLWPGIALTLAAWAWARRPTWIRAALFALALASLSLLAWLMFRTPLAHSAWALLVLPLIALATQLDLRVPRLRWMFYAYYPAHLLAIWLWRVLG